LNLDALASALSAVLPSPPPLEPLADKGLAHWHVRLVGTGWLARVPKQSQMDLAAADNLRYQSACFERAAPSGHVPMLHRMLPPSADLPRGALLVQEIEGQPLRGARDVPALMQALAAIHALPLPVSAERAPLLSEANPLAALVTLIQAQAPHLDHPAVPAASARAVKARLAGLVQRMAPQVGACPQRLISFDAHPGNFLIRPDGQAVLVDLEKLRYSYPPLDLAHATLHTSTTWDREVSFELSVSELVRAYDVWARAVGPALAGPCAPALVPLRELMWLWSVTWCAKWLAESGKLPSAGRRAPGEGEDWSTRHSEAALVAHVQDRVTHYLSPACVERLLAEFGSLQQALGG